MRDPEVRIVKSIPGPYTAITLPPFGIFLQESLIGTPNFDAIVAHEHVHWEQAKQHGIFSYYALYLVHLIRYGYENHPFELEAQERSGVH
jgi:hypothetical protein